MQGWSIVGVMLVLCFLTAFFYQRSRMAIAQRDTVQTDFQALQQEQNRRDLPALYEERVAAREGALRDEYESRDTALTTELSRLYELEKEVRVISGLPSMESAADMIESADGGQGGPPDGAMEGDTYVDDPRMNPPQIIYGLANPSADLMLHEMRVRSGSLSRLLVDLEAQRIEVAHTPSVWPSSGDRRRINSRFGMRRDPFTNERQHHSGVDITADYGSEIVSTANGKVRFSGYHQYLGNVVKIDHGNGIETWYGHMSKRLVDTGDAVLRGDVLGKVGSTGRATGPHIHYEVHVNGRRVNPQNFIGN